MFTGSKDKIVDFKNKIVASFKKIREELEDHLDSINENTNEIQGNYEYLCQLDNKIEKLNERMDKIQMMVEKMADGSYKSEFDAISKYEFSIEEQEVFIILYTLSHDESMTSSAIAKKCGLKKSIVEQNLALLESKEVPIKRQKVKRTVRYFIDNKFRDYQAKFKVLKFDDNLIKNMNF